jgi:hypothetical protein
MSQKPRILRIYDQFFLSFPSLSSIAMFQTIKVRRRMTDIKSYWCKSLKTQLDAEL